MMMNDGMPFFKLKNIDRHLKITTQITKKVRKTNKLFIWKFSKKLIKNIVLKYTNTHIQTDTSSHFVSHHKCWYFPLFRHSPTFAARPFCCLRLQRLQKVGNFFAHFRATFHIIIIPNFLIAKTRATRQRGGSDESNSNVSDEKHKKHSEQWHQNSKIRHFKNTTCKNLKFFVLN